MDINNINKKKIIKFIYNFIVILSLAIIMEIFIFNFNNIKDMSDKSIKKNIVLSIKDSKLINWEKTDEKYISQFDPMVVYNDVNLYIKKIEINSNMNKIVPYIDLFYTSENKHEFNGNMLIRISDIKQTKNIVYIDQNIKDIRLDLGDDAGLILTDFYLIINPVKLDINISRIIAIIFIYFIGFGLFLLQKSPNYDILLNQEEGTFDGKDD